MLRGSKRLAGVTAAVLTASVLGAGIASAHGDDGHRDRAQCAADAKGRSGKGLAIVGLTADNKLTCIDAARPGRSSRGTKVTGLVNDTRLIGIDYRPATGALYGVGELGGIYTINPVSAVATPVAQLSVALAGTTFGVDFNPTVDRLRIVSDTQQNLRVDVTTGVAITDLALSGAGVAGAAYTNNDTDPNTATTLFDVDATLDQVVIQAPANNGNLSPTGKLGVDTSNAVGFDIYSRISGGTTVDLHTFASLTVGGQAGLYKVDLLTGKAHARGAFPVPVVDIAIPLDQR